MKTVVLDVLGRKVLRASVIGAALALSATASATTVSPNSTINTLGLENNNVYFRLNSMPAACPLYYIDTVHLTGGTDTVVSRMFAQLTTAYVSGKAIKRVDYVTAGTSALCYAQLIEF